MDTGDVLIFLVPFGIVLLPFILRYRHLRRSWLRSLLIGLLWLWAYAFLLYRLDSTWDVQLGGYALPVILTYLAVYSSLAGLVLMVYLLQPRESSTRASTTGHA